MASELLTSTVYLKEGKDITPHIGAAFAELFSGKFDEEQAVNFLLALNEKGESPSEFANIIKSYYAHAPWHKFNVENASIQNQMVDVCGTGGDGKHSLNVSTTVAFVVAGAGGYVVKHGNKAVSSTSGSSDVLSALGVEINVDAEIMKHALQEAHIAFLFAPKYHPVFKQLASLRARIAKRTVFNLLGPAINPAQPKRQLIGVYAKDKMPVYAEHLKGSIHAMIVHSKNGMDELSADCQNDVIEIKNGIAKTYEIDPKKYKLLTYTGSIEGGDADYNAKRLIALLKGEDKTLYLSTVLLNAGTALYVADKANSIEEGIAVAQEAIDSGAAFDALQALIKITRVN